MPPQSFLSPDQWPITHRRRRNSVMIVILISSTQQRECRRSGNLCHQSTRFVRCSLQNSQRAIVFLFFPAGKSGLRHAAWRITESRAVLRADAGFYRLHKLNAVVAFTFWWITPHSLETRFDRCRRVWVIKVIFTDVEIFCFRKRAQKWKFTSETKEKLAIACVRF